MRVDFLPRRFRWTLHNLVGHPLTEILSQIGCHRAADWIHEATKPNGYREGL